MDCVCERVCLGCFTLRHPSDIHIQPHQDCTNPSDKAARLTDLLDWLCLIAAFPDIVSRAIIMPNLKPPVTTTEMVCGPDSKLTGSHTHSHTHSLTQPAHLHAHSTHPSTYNPPIYLLTHSLTPSPTHALTHLHSHSAHTRSCTHVSHFGTFQALEYRERIVNALDGTRLVPLMTLYLTDTTTPEEIVRAKASGHVYAVKL